jgi:predicted PurR-regulated permease PerM
VAEKEIIIPAYIKTILLIIGLLAFFTILYITRSIIVPIVIAVIIAIVLHPLVNFFVHHRINRLIAISITMFITFLILAGFCTLIIFQTIRFSDSLPALTDKLTLIVSTNISDASVYFDINPDKIYEWINKAKVELINYGSAAIGQTLVIIGNGLIVIFLLPVYVFLILYYQPILLKFIRMLFIKSNPDQVSKIVTQTKTVIQHYLIGLVIETAIVATLNSIALLSLGIEYAILLGIVGAMLNVIPYIGGIISVAIFMLVALVTKSPVYVLYILVIYSTIQFIDNHYLVPKIVASKVKINALIAIAVVIAGNSLWGVPGMFLSIPLLAIVKLICDNIESLKPWGFLLGDTMPPVIKIEPTRLRRIKNKSK